MAKPHHPDNRPNITEGPGGRVTEAGVAEVEVGEIGVKQEDKTVDPPPAEL